MQKELLRMPTQNMTLTTIAIASFDNAVRPPWSMMSAGNSFVRKPARNRSMTTIIPDRWLTPHRNGGSAAPEYSPFSNNSFQLYHLPFFFNRVKIGSNGNQKWRIHDG